MAILRKDFLVKFEDDSGGNRQWFLMFCLLQFISHLSRLGWVNKLHSNVSHSPTSSYRLISMFLFLFAFLLQFCNLCRLIRFHIALNFSPCSPCLQEGFFRVKLISLQTLLYCFISFKHWKLFQVTKLRFSKRIRRRKRFFHFIFSIASG